MTSACPEKTCFPSKKNYKIINVPTDKLVVMVDVSRFEFNKLLKSLREYQKSGSSSTDDLEKKVKLWKNRHNVSSAELRRRVNNHFNSMESQVDLKE